MTWGIGFGCEAALGGRLRIELWSILWTFNEAFWVCWDRCPFDVSGFVELQRFAEKRADQTLGAVIKNAAPSETHTQTDVACNPKQISGWQAARQKIKNDPDAPAGQQFPVRDQPDRELKSGKIGQNLFHARLDIP